MNKKIDNQDNDDLENDDEIQVNDVRSDIEAAYDSALPEDEKPEGTPDDKTGDTKGEKTDKVEKPEAAKTQDKEQKKQEKEGAKTTAEGDDIKVEAEKTEEVKAPINVSPKLREKWKDLDPEWKKHISEREKEIATTMQETAQSRKLGDNFLNLVQPYIPIMQAEGAQSPLHAVEELLKTVSALRMGSPQQKAARMAQLINHYGIDIAMLDDTLVSQGQGKQQTNGGTVDPNISAVIDQKLQPVNQLIERFNKASADQQQANQRSIQKEIQDFAADPKHEFYNDVRETMADLMDVAAKNGKAMSMEEAYRQACVINPEINEIMTKRLKDAELLENKNNLQNKKRASSSLGTGDTRPENNLNRGNDLRSDLLNAWDDQLAG